MYIKNNETIMCNSVKTFPNSSAIKELNELSKKNETFKAKHTNESSISQEYSPLTLILLLLLLSDSEPSFLPIALMLMNL